MRKQHAADNPIVFLDIAIDREIVGRIVIELRADVVPKTAENFLRLCNGTAGVGSFSKKPLTYEGTNFHKVQRMFAVQGGDVARNSGYSGESIYGRYFDDENFTLLNEMGAVGMANCGRPNSNNSQFYIASVDCTNLDGTHVVVGYILRGLGIIEEMEKYAGNQYVDDYKPTRPIRVHRCGQLMPGEPWGLGESDDKPDKLPPFPMDWEDQPAEIPHALMLSLLDDIKVSAKQSFQAKDFVNAGRRYRKLNRYYKHFLANTKSTDKDIKQQLDEVNRLNSGNLSLIELKLGHWKEAIALCEDVLKHDKHNCRALFRRGKANLQLENFEDGLRDIKAANLLQPNDGSIEQELLDAQRMWKVHIGVQRQKYKKMFN